ncbi:MAG: dipeptide epimerase [Chitinophagia bacterium]|jgi:L-alanine-DL-glutamate epimerase-like enolase superfamily enzyme
MKIVAVRSYLKKMALTKPYTIAYSTFSDVTLAFFEVELANGMIGYGSGSPAGEVVGETTDQTAVNLQTDFVKNFVGRDIRHFQQMIYETRKHFDHLPGTQAAIDIAMHDAFAKFIGISVADFYGQKIKALPTSITIGIKSVQETLEDAAGFLKLGFKILKVKMGLNVEEDIEKICKLHEQHGNQFIIRVDPNQGYSLADLNKFLGATKHVGVELIEQPLPVGKELALLNVEPAYRKILMGDESLKDPQAALEFAISKPFGVYNIKLMKCGGVMGAMEIATIANNAQINLFWGCNDESILSITAALHAAYCCANTRYIDLDGSFDLAADLVTGGFELVDGYMHINQQPGFGITKL